MFEKATRKKFRFVSPQGNLNVEDLWDLNLTSLDNVARSLYNEIQLLETVSFVKPKRSNSDLQTKFELVKHIIDTKMNEAETAQDAKKVKEQNQKILEIINLKKNAALMETPVEELEKMLK